MDSFFRNTTPYTVIPEPVPKCFIRLERRLGPKIRHGDHPLSNLYALWAHNLCQRMGDVEFYADRIRSELDNNRAETPPVLGSLLIGHFSACKSVFDAAAIALAGVFKLVNNQGNPLTPKQQDFGKPVLMNALATRVPTVHRRYAPFLPLVRDIIDWRDKSMHRAAPLVILTMERDSITKVANLTGYQFAAGSDVDYAKLTGKGMANTYLEITYFHDKWRPSLLNLCEEICNDIFSNC